MFLLNRALPVLIIFFIAEKSFGQHSKALKLEGRTMGTTYSIVYFDGDERNFSRSVDSLLKCVNKGINHYEPTSDVSSFNKSSCGGADYSIHFTNLLSESLKIANESDGNFDPTVMPLVNLWGFGPEKQGKPTQEKIDSIKKFVGYRHVNVNEGKISKDDANVQLDFGGIGQGYGVDMICDFLRSKGIRNFLVELGGEGFASGKNLDRGENWRVGIIDPFLPKEDQQLIGYAVLEDEAFTTSGNYFNYRFIEGKKYGHTVSPFTGHPVEHDLISVSFFTKDCTTADGWDTAILTAGKDNALNFLKEHPELSAVLIYVENEKPAIFISDKIKNKIFIDPSYDH